MALIITIIVLLILAVVSIRAVTNDGIIAHAKNARTEYEQAQANESAMLDSYLKELDDATKGEGLTTQQAVTAGLKVGDYVEYPVEYTNPNSWSDIYSGWRVLSIEEEGANSYVRLVSAGAPLVYLNYSDKGETYLNNLTTGFFSVPIDTFDWDVNPGRSIFFDCGFKDMNGDVLDSMEEVKTLFTNKYTQLENDIPKVQALTKEDLEGVFGGAINYGDYIDVDENNLIVVPGDVWLASWRGDYNGTDNAYVISYNGWMTTYGGASRYVRPVVSLKSDIKLTKTSEGHWALQ